jgi:hypothetical protein
VTSRRAPRRPTRSNRAHACQETRCGAGHLAAQDEAHARLLGSLAQAEIA